MEVDPAAAAPAHLGLTSGHLFPSAALQACSSATGIRTKL